MKLGLDFLRNEGGREEKVELVVGRESHGISDGLEALDAEGSVGKVRCSGGVDGGGGGGGGVETISVQQRSLLY